MIVQVYNRWDSFVGSIAQDDLLTFIHTDELNGEDSVEIQTVFHLREGYRLVWRDLLGKVHEHVCQDPKALHAGACVIYSDTALNSICETFGDYIEDKRPYSYTFQKALEVALAPTRWSVGKVDVTGKVSSGLTFYHTSAREALQAILECGGELETVITYSKDGVTKREVNLLTQRGTSASATHKRFCYSKDITSVSKTEHYGAITACYGYGKGVETDSGGYGRKLTFGDINNKKNYVEDQTALKAYGRPNGSGGYAHVFGEYENSECEDAAQLLQETKDYLASHNEPGVTYEADVVDLVQFGRNWEGVAVGDSVHLVDTEFDPPLRCAGRVSKLVVDVLGGTQTVTLGNVTETLSDIISSQQKTIKSLSTRTANWDVAASTPTAYLQQIIDGLNEEFNNSGASYCYTSFEQGTIWASVPLDKNGRATKTSGAWAIQINSKGFRIASGVNADGSWNWRTFGTGEGFTADVINAGVIKGGSNYWNLNTGELVFKQGSIRSADGKSVWDLSNNSFKTTNMNAVNMTANTSMFTDCNATNLTATKAVIKDSTATNLTATNSTFNTCTSNNMTANNIKANGSLRCGSTSNYLYLTNSGELEGYRNGSRVGYIDYSGVSTYIPTGETWYGLQIQCVQCLRISSPHIAIADSSNVSQTAWVAVTNTMDYVSKIEDAGNGSIRWYPAQMTFVNGYCTSNGGTK